MSDQMPIIEYHGATAMGWVRRLDLGLDVWERPDGKLYKHRNDSEPELARVPPIVCLPLMTKPAREVEKGTKYLPEVWKPEALADHIAMLKERCIAPMPCICDQCMGPSEEWTSDG